MKKILHSLLFISFLLLFSCNTNDDIDQPILPAYNEDDILGVWYPKDAVVGEAVFPYEGHEDCAKDYLEFTTTGSMREVDIKDCEEDIIWEGSYHINNNILILSGNGERHEMGIAELTTESLILTFRAYHNGRTDEVQARYNRE